MDHYSKYSENDFILDDDFRRWVKEPCIQSDVFWKRFLQKYPGKKTELDRSRALLQSLIFTKGLNDSEKNSIWQAVEGSTIGSGRKGKLI